MATLKITRTRTTRKYRKSKITKRGKSAKFVFGGLNPPLHPILFLISFYVIL